MCKFKKYVCVLICAVLLIGIVAFTAVAASSETASAEGGQRVTRPITVYYETLSGENKGSEEIAAADTQDSIPASSLKSVPQGFRVVGEVTIDGSLARAILQPDTQVVTVQYQTTGGVHKGQEELKVLRGRTTVPAADLRKVPADYQVTGDVYIDGCVATAVVERMTRTVTVNYETAEGMGKGSEEITVDAAQESIPASALKAVPQGFHVVGQVEIDGRMAKAVVEPDTQAVTVNYVTASGIRKGQEEIRILKTRTTVTAQDLKAVPEDYRVAGDVILEGGEATVTVEPATRVITVNYETAEGEARGSEEIAVSASQESIPASALKSVPQGFRVVGEVAIDGSTARATVAPQSV